MIDFALNIKDSVQEYWTEFFVFVQKYKLAAGYLIAIEVLEAIAQIAAIASAGGIVQHAMTSSKFSILSSDLKASLWIFLISFTALIFLTERKKHKKLRGVGDIVRVIASIFALPAFAMSVLILFTASWFIRITKEKIRIAVRILFIIFAGFALLNAISLVNNDFDTARRLIVLLGLFIPIVQVSINR